MSEPRFHVTFPSGRGVTCVNRGGQLFPVAGGPWFPADVPVNATGARIARVAPADRTPPCSPRGHSRVPVYLRAHRLHASGPMGALVRATVNQDPSHPAPVTILGERFWRFIWERDLLVRAREDARAERHNPYLEGDPAPYPTKELP